MIKLLSMNSIYLDYAASTPVLPEVREAMLPYFESTYGNPSSLHQHGLDAERALKESTQTCATHLGVRPDDIAFTSGGTESCNLAIIGFALANQDQGKHIVISAIEHKAVYEAAEFLKAFHGFEVGYALPDAYGYISVDAVRAVTRPDTILVSVIYAHNEFGTINPVQKIGYFCHKKKIALHTDACQATNYLPIDIDQIKADLITINASKIYGPKGVGLLAIRRGIQIQPLIVGGGQQNDKRSGTENIPGIVGFATALDIARSNAKEESLRLTKLRDTLISKTLTLPNMSLIGHPTTRTPNNICIQVGNLEAEAIVLFMNERGISIGAGSACSSSDESNHYIYDAIEASPEVIRFSLGRQTKSKDIERTTKCLEEVLVILQ
jgi:cysteine desulfurase